MRKHLSVARLWLRMTFWGSLAIILLTAAAQLGLFLWKLASVTSRDIASFSEMEEAVGFGITSRLSLALLGAWLLISLRASRGTVGRLSVSEEAATAWNAAVNLGWIILWWAAQLAVIFAGFELFRCEADPTSLSGQSLMIALYRCGPFHWLLPLSDVLTAVSATVYAVTIALSLAMDCMRLRGGGRFPFRAVLMPALLIFAGQLSAPCAWIVLIACAAMTALNTVMLIRGLRKGV